MSAVLLYCEDLSTGLFIYFFGSTEQVLKIL